MYKFSLAEQLQEWVTVPTATQNIVTGQTEQKDVSITTSANIGLPNSPEESEGATSSSPSVNQLHM